MPVADRLNKIPMAFRAQVQGRCQLQRIDPDRSGRPQDAELWVQELIKEVYPEPPQFENLRTRTYQISWRFITNSGQDEGIIRPVIGARGYPFYPGSSMKGAFRKACNEEQKLRYCGSSTKSRDLHPGILRFHGGYPTGLDWTKRLVDIVHPQQERQVMIGNQGLHSSAFVQISLYRPELRFAISSRENLSEEEWETIWQVWEKAFSMGIGCRVSAGYGHPSSLRGEQLYSPHHIKGRGMASKLLSGEGEFRPNMFRAGIRGHAMRIFGGLTDERTATREVERLFGGVTGHGTVGLLAMNFVIDRLVEGTFGNHSWRVPTYEVEGKLEWILTRPLANEDHLKILRNLILHLNMFAMIFGGFGKSWRRADHRLFYQDYYRANNRPLIGCHWQWMGSSLGRDVGVRKLESIPSFLDSLQNAARKWLELHKVQFSNQCRWREAWRVGNVQVWGRLADGKDDAITIEWLHGNYSNRKSIKGTSITGSMGQIGRLWHRMYPVVEVIEGERKHYRPNGKYLELITIFPDQSSTCRDFLYFLKDGGEFRKLWG